MSEFPDKLSGHQIPERILFNRKLMSIKNAMLDQAVEKAVTDDNTKREMLENGHIAFKKGNRYPVALFGSDEIEFVWFSEQVNESNDIHLDALTLTVVLYEDGSPYVPENDLDQVNSIKYTIISTPDMPPLMFNLGYLEKVIEEPLAWGNVVELKQTVEHFGPAIVHQLTDEECLALTESLPKAQPDIWIKDMISANL